LPLPVSIIFQIDLVSRDTWKNSRSCAGEAAQNNAVRKMQQPAACNDSEADRIKPFCLQYYGTGSTGSIVIFFFKEEGRSSTRHTITPTWIAFLKYSYSDSQYATQNTDALFYRYLKPKSN
jgi:hypothetical protein